MQLCLRLLKATACRAAAEKVQLKESAKQREVMGKATERHPNSSKAARCKTGESFSDTTVFQCQSDQVRNRGPIRNKGETGVKGDLGEKTKGESKGCFSNGEAAEHCRRSRWGREDPGCSLHWVDADWEAVNELGCSLH